MAIISINSNLLSRASILAAATLLLAPAAQAAEPSYAGKVDSLRAERLAELTKPDGWLSLIGLHFLQQGSNSIGSAADNQVVLAAGPAHMGTAVVGPLGGVVFTPAPGANVLVDGKTVEAVPLSPSGTGSKATSVSSGSVSFFVIERGGRLALRVKDSSSERRIHFLGLDYFPTDPSWRIQAKWVPFDPVREVPITNILGNVSQERVPGKAVFERAGKTYELVPLQESPSDPLFFIISDATSGNTTYRMRFLGAEPPKDGTVILDFNLAENPPCGFTPFATCPLPPKENRLPLAVTAGEKAYRGSHE
jgi:uncharacterized protein (DUF1684 family)